MFVILIISLITRLFFFSETILLEKKKHTVVKFNDCRIFASVILRHVPFFYV